MTFSRAHSQLPAAFAHLRGAIRKVAPSVLSAASQLPLLIIVRSLIEDTRLKIRASTIINRVSSMAELLHKNKKVLAFV